MPVGDPTFETAADDLLNRIDKHRLFARDCAQDFVALDPADHQSRCDCRAAHREQQEGSKPPSQAGPHKRILLALSHSHGVRVAARIAGSWQIVQ